ncbi:TRAP transporter substrate-binding protein [Hydrogenophaga sp.]|uniref:TRAP transporter substrate-binding protein n=1 Tax=Hydrogenophaga sp. TaxID=1904254 RepID=UPI0026292D88|nr:TRAP transporter substrate-binding protein [Hydrogenophaga sp.]MDM7949604.1 TRAP transporter substrate-binding protein [Hydrogenophaga sp.]
MNARIRLHAIAAGATLALLGATGTAQAQTTTLTLSSWVPSNHYVVKDILQPWMADVEKATEGRVKINLLPKPVGAPAQHWELARKGVADITWGNFTYEPERFKHVWFAELPMMGSNGEASSVALWRTFDKYLARNEAFKGVVMLGTGMLGGGQFHHPAKVIDTPDDLKGQKVRMGGPIQKRLLEDLGAIPVSGPGPKAYEMLEGGVIDASLHAMESVVNFRLDGKLKNHTLIPGGLYDATFFIVMNEGKFQRLSAADQQAILKLSGEALSRRWGQQFDAQNKASEEKLRGNGHKFAQPSPALLDNIRKVRTAMLQELNADGPKFGVADHNAVVTFYEQQYKLLAK